MGTRAAMRGRVVRAAMRGRLVPVRRQRWTGRLSAQEIVGAVTLVAVIVIISVPQPWLNAASQLWSMSAIAASPSSTVSPNLAGPARVIDGDTLEIDGERIRLHGVDAFERNQTCGAGASTWYCGLAGTDALTRRLDGRTVSCEPLNTDRYGRTVARCRTGGEDIGAWMVERGMALAYRQYSLDYVEAEDRARAARLGVWRDTAFTAPQDWRAAR